MNDRDRIRELEQQTLKIAKSLVEIVRAQNAQAIALRSLQQAMVQLTVKESEIDTEAQAGV